MKKTAKILIFTLALVLITVCFSVVSFADDTATETAEGTTYYFTPAAKWKPSGTTQVRYAVCVWNSADGKVYNSTTNPWFSMTDDDGDGVWECVIPNDVVFDKMAFVRMKATSTTNSWSNQYLYVSQHVAPSPEGYTHYVAAAPFDYSYAGGFWSPAGEGDCPHTPSDPLGTIISGTECGNSIVEYTCKNCEEKYSFKTSPDHAYTVNGAICMHCHDHPTLILVGTTNICDGINWGDNVEQSIIINKMEFSTADYKYHIKKDIPYDKFEWKYAIVKDDGTLNWLSGNNKTMTPTDAQKGGIIEFIANGLHGTPNKASGYVIDTSTLKLTANTQKYELPSANVGDLNYMDFDEAFAAAIESGETLKILKAITLEKSYTIPAGKTLNLNLNMKTITGIDKTDKNFGLFSNNGTLIISGDGKIPATTSNAFSGKITLKAEVNSGWNRYSAVISNNPGGTLIIHSGSFQHLGGTDMAYAIDSLTNGNLGDTNVTINGYKATNGTHATRISSTYRAIRQFLNSSTCENNLTITCAQITGTNNGIFFHDPSTKSNNGSLIIEGDSSKISGVYLFVTAGSTEWPVEVSIPSSVITGEVTAKNVPAGYVATPVNGVYGVLHSENNDEATLVSNGTVTYYATVAEAIAAAAEGDTVYLLQDITGDVNVNKGIIFDGNNRKVNGKLNITGNGATVKNLIVDNGSSNGGYINAKDVLVENCNVKGGNGFRSCYTDGLVTFKNCVVTGNVYGIHFDGKAGGEIVIDGCTITGWTSFAKTIKKVSMIDTSFEDGNYNYVRFYQEEIVIDGCTFNENMAVDIAGVETATVTVTDCTVENGEVADLFETQDKGNCDIIIDNVQLLPVATVVIGEDKTHYESLADAFAALTNGATLIIYEGTYDYALALGAGTSDITVIGEGNVTLNGIPSIKGTNYRVENIDFVYADSYNNLSGSGYIKDCTFTNNTNNTFRYCYGVTNGEITFDGCTLTAKQWAIHFDSVAGTKLNFINCNVNGRVALGADLGALTATGTNFENGYVNVWGSAEEVSFSDCEFVNIPYIFTGYDKGNTFKFNDCTVVDADGVQTGVIDLIYGGNDSANADIYVDDVLKSGDAKIGDAYYRTVTDAINAAVDGDVITIQARTISEEIVVSDHINRFGGKNITIEGAADFGTTLTGGLYIGYDDNNPYTGSVTVRGIKFEGKGLTLVQLDSVTVEGCQFSNMANFARAAGESFNAITVICDDLTDSVVIKNNVINGAEMGIRVRSPKALTVENNTISNTLHNAITVENSKFATNDAPVVIADNNITNWGLSGEGRALRMVLGSGDNIQAKSVTVTGNLMETDVAPEGFIKMTAVDSTMTVNLSSNVLIGELADGAEAIAIEGTGADSVDTSNNPAVESNEPHILDGYWWIGTYNTGVRAEAISIESAEVNADNELVITLSNGAVLNLGNVKGDAGRGIVNVTINANNELVIEYTDGTTAVLGNVKGDTGVGIKDVKLVDYELIVTLTDGTEINLGNIRGQQGVGVGKVEIVDNKLIVTLTDGTVVDLGNVKGDEGRGVENVEKNDKNEFVITLTDGTVINLGNVKGDTGTGIEKIEKNDKNELVITLTDGTVVNLGNIKGDQGIQGIPGEKGEKGDDGIDGADGADGNDNNQVVITSIAVATAAIIFALAVLLFWRAKRRSWWCIR